VLTMTVMSRNVRNKYFSLPNFINCFVINFLYIFEMIFSQL